VAKLTDPPMRATRSKTAEAIGKKVGSAPLSLEVELTPLSPRTLSTFKKIPAAPADPSKHGESSRETVTMPKLRSSRSREFAKLWTGGVHQVSRNVRAMDRTALEADRARDRSKTSSIGAPSPPGTDEDDSEEDEDEEGEEEDEDEDEEEEEAAYRGN
jgi:hypothetical protein